MGEQSVRDAAASVSADNGGGGAQEGAISAIGQPLAHDSAHLHVTGLARYCDDVAEPRNLLHAAVGMSTSAHADLVHVSLSRVRSAPGVVLALSAGDIPGDNNCGPVFDDDPIFAPGVVHYAGQSIFAVAATTVIAARRAVHHAQIDYRESPSILTAREAHAAGSYVLPSEQLVRGDSRAAIDGAAHRLTGAVTLGGQDQFYLEGHIAIASPEEDGAMHVLSST
ncbi:MAG: molybdopterin-dependent oxidoreductase, partial [Chromatiales bacterium]|nr:molybdopterin-dependent oxidoreductase [Chromatiales bacterium]